LFSSFGTKKGLTPVPFRFEDRLEEGTGIGFVVDDDHSQWFHKAAH
jgi:hypothetical protein